MHRFAITAHGASSSWCSSHSHSCSAAIITPPHSTYLQYILCAPICHHSLSSWCCLSHSHSCSAAIMTPPHPKYSQCVLYAQICHQCSWYLEPLVLIPQLLVMYRRKSYPFWVSLPCVTACSELFFLCMYVSLPWLVFFELIFLCVRFCVCYRVSDMQGSVCL